MEILTNSTRGTQARRCAASTIVMRATMTSLEPATVTVIFTKQIPRGVFELMVPGMRWNLRGNAYAYFMGERYPPFIWG